MTLENDTEYAIAVSCMKQLRKDHPLTDPEDILILCDLGLAIEDYESEHWPIEP